MSSRSYKVKFLPGGESVEVGAGTNLLEAAAEAGLLIEAICGGKGTCGSCLMEVRSVEPAEPQLVYGCREQVDDDLVVTPLETGIGERRRIVTGTSYLLRQTAQLTKEELHPLCRKVQLEVPPPSIDLAQSDGERLVRALKQSEGIDVVQLDLEILRQLPDALRLDGGCVEATLWDEPGNHRLLFLGRGARHRLGVACDLGTSTVVLKLIDLVTGKTLGVASDYNRQVRSGADVVSRIDFATAKPGNLESLQTQAVTTINVLLRRLCQQTGRRAETIGAMVVSGNTTMIHLMLGIQPRYIREEPYVPVFAELPSYEAGELGLEIHPGGRVLCVPAVGSWVGGDIVSGVLSQRRVGRRGEVFLFIDIGTNGEIVLGSDDWMLCCACSAGPAFEGGGVQSGMRATTGAIERIALTAEGIVRTYDVIGGGRPRGLCGSALIQLLGELWQFGVVDRRGRLVPHERVVRFGRMKAFVVEGKERTDNGRDLLLTENDIDNLVRAKGAIYSGCSLLLRKVGLSFHDLDRVYVAGGFGRYIAVEQAVSLGMLPDLPAEQFTFLGNSSLTGAALMMLSSKQRDLAFEIARTMTYVELCAEPQYMDEHTGALFLPHTDMSLFPSRA